MSKKLRKKHLKSKKSAIRKHIANREAKKLSTAVELVNAGMLTEAEDICNTVIEILPDNADALHLIGVIKLRKQDYADAVFLLNKAAKLNPTNFQVHARLGISYFNTGNYQEAVSSYQKALELNPNDASIYFNLGHVYYLLERFDAALEAYNNALRLKPDYYHALTNIGIIMMDLGHKEAALDYFNKSLAINPNYIETHINLGNYWALFGSNTDESKVEFHYKTACRLDPRNADAIASYANYLDRNGKSREAYELLLPLVQSENVVNERIALTFGYIASEFDKQREAVDILQRVLDTTPRKLDARKSIHFALGNLYDKIGDYDNAFTHFKQANELRKVRWGVKSSKDELKAIKKAYSEYSLPYSNNRSELPVFIVGMPRSGTSLVEQILASHPKVYGAGELGYLRNHVEKLPEILSGAQSYPECIQLLNVDNMDRFADDYVRYLEALLPGSGEIRVTDKMPANFWILGFIHHLFPHARIIHCKRDPRDTCLSCYFQDFSFGHSYKNDLGTLGRYYRQYEDIMRFWTSRYDLNILDVQYEELVARPEEHIRSLIQFCGLEWDETCLAFYKSKRLSRTASLQQVREPIYTQSVGRWRKYKKYLRELFEALNEDNTDYVH